MLGICHWIVGLRGSSTCDRRSWRPLFSITYLNELSTVAGHFSRIFAPQSCRAAQAQRWTFHSRTNRCFSLCAVWVAATIVASSPAAQDITDGDTLKMGGTNFRLWGIDAPEAKQTCDDGWPAGRIAATRLQALTTGRNVVCQAKDRDRYGRTVAICRASGEDLGAIMVREGMAWAFVRYSSDYVPQEAKAKAKQLGVHKHNCQPAWEWRAQQRAPAKE